VLLVPPDLDRVPELDLGSHIVILPQDIVPRKDDRTSFLNNIVHTVANPWRWANCAPNHTTQVESTPWYAGPQTKVITMNGSHMNTKTNISEKYIYNVERWPSGGSIPPRYIRTIHDITYTIGMTTQSGQKPSQKKIVDGSS
jgi:hypothetical protein